MNQPSDTFAQQTRRLASEVQRLRDWAGGDPARLGRVADALVGLTAHRLSGHAWAEAAADAQEAVTLSARALAEHGPVGPYTPRADAVRSITALVHLALIQSAAGLHPQAGQVIAAVLGLRDQLSRLELDAALAPRTVAWALLVWARAGLAAGDVAAANARVDAAVAGGADDGEFLAIDLDRAASDARWAAGWPEPSVEFALRAVERYESLALELLERPAQLPPPMLDRLSEPLFGLYGDAADRVLAIGAPGLGLGLRRRLVDLLGALAVARPEAQQMLVSALSDLADDLRGLGRAAEADDVAALASSIAGDAEGDGLPRRERARLGDRASWEPLPPAEAFGVEVQPAPSGRLAALRGPADAAERERQAEAEAELARRAERDAAEAARLAAEAETRRVEQERLAAEEAERERREAAEAAERERAERRRKRAERIAEHEREAERERAEREAALRARVSDETPEERAEREELERLAAELAALEAAEAAEAERLRLAELGEAQRLADEEAVRERWAAEEAERRRLVELAEAQRRAAEEAEGQRLAAEEAERERIATEQAEAERLAAEEAERERLAAERAETEQLALKQAERERLAAEEERERLAVEEAERERLAAEAERERLAAEEAERVRLAAERVEAERLAAEQAERERLAAEDAERERLAAEEAERERLAAEEAERERLAVEEAERERLAVEEAERERLAAEEAERERLAAEEAERERLAVEEAERERFAAEEAERERLAAEAEQERLAAEEAERERLAVEEAERERLAAEEAERERLAAEQAERERLAAEQADQEALDRARTGLEEAAATGKRRDVRDASEALVDELRGRYESEPERYLADFLDALDQLATARWQAGDWWGSRGPSKEAKTLRKQHGL